MRTFREQGLTRVRGLIPSRVRRPVLLAVTLVVIGGGCLAPLALAGGAGPPKKALVPATGQTVHIFHDGVPHGKQISRSLRADFSLFLAASQHDVRPASAAGTAEQEMSDLTAALASGGAASSAAAAAGVSSTANATYVQIGSDVYAAVIPGSTGVCFAAAMPTLQATGIHEPSRIGMACDTTASVEQHGIGQELFSADGSSSEMIGLVPDGNSTVTVANDDGTTATVPVESNIFYVHSSTPIGEIGIIASSGAVTTMGGG